ncbi:hypothetical protein AKJ37_02840 [candidate division MSBL1 archaeon SCGC-AAA259I09]|uniref:Glycosyltransferase 2-like domain-containing protein n=2 Tax=candidate division MSBL1 TaxID=215777 RepID=A0A133UTK5_9EURY|nr:hypothetical protein AKJ37_02840 [candidate division MSBL1 archaeon SCGC-AAA259I09]KXA98800.1 hypothetical protein AKJ39_00750 [candidate division MSBL1 archaeon SCGC-AAA259J03]
MILVRIAALLLFVGITWSIFMGIYLLKGKKRIYNEKNFEKIQSQDFPKVSLLIPAKNEQEALERLVKKLVRLDYPDYEIILIEGESSDNTPQICKKYERKYPNLIKLIEEQKNKGKPAALNLGLKKATGEIIGVLDADSYIKEKNFLKQIISKFRDEKIAAVQGKISLISPENSLASRLSNFSRYLPLPYLVKGKERIGGFVPLFGTHQYIRKSVIEKIGGWNEEALTEDIDLSLELHKRDLKIEYSLAEVLEEPPASFKSFLKQNVRHARGMIQSLFTHITDLDFSKIKGWDAILTLSSPLLISLGLIGFLTILFVLPFLLRNDIVLTLVALITCATALGIINSKYSNESKTSHAPWLLLLWLVQSGIGIFAFAAEIFGMSRDWNRTEKKTTTST